MKTLLFSLLVVVLSGCGNPANNSNSQDDFSSFPETSVSPVQTNHDLPAKATEFLGAYFSAQRIKNVIKKKSPVADGTFFEVELSDFTEVDFDKDGNWVEINGEDNAELPITILPTSIQKYLNTHYTRTAVTSIDKTDNEYALDLSNDVEVYFDSSGNFVKEDK